MTVIGVTRKRQRSSRINIMRDISTTFKLSALIHLRLCKSCNNLFISRATPVSVATP